MKPRRKGLRKGTGDHLHDIIKAWTGQDFRPGCGCEKWLRKMNRGGPTWTANHLEMIVEKLRREATKRRWWKFFARMPGVRFPIRTMVLESIRRSQT